MFIYHYFADLLTPVPTLFNLSISIEKDSVKSIEEIDAQKVS